MYLISMNVGRELAAGNFSGYSGKLLQPGNVIPDRGSVVLNTQNFDHDWYNIGEMVDLEKITLTPGQGLVIKFWPGSENTLI